MPEHHIPYRYNTYTDVLLAVGTATLARSLYGLPETRIELHARPDGFYVHHPPGEAAHGTNPFKEIDGKPGWGATPDLASGRVWNKANFEDHKDKPTWWDTVSVINTLASPGLNNKIAQSYTPLVGKALLQREASMKQFPALKNSSRSQLLYAHASKGVNNSAPATAQSNAPMLPEQALALLGFQQGGSGFIPGNKSKSKYTLCLIPRPYEITLAAYLELVDRTLRGYKPEASSGVPLPPRDQTVPFFTAMAYFKFVVALFDYRKEAKERRFGVGKIISGLDRVVYFKQGKSSAPFLVDTLTIPDWLDELSVAANVRDLVRATYGRHQDPNTVYLAVRAFAEKDPRLLVKFYRLIEPLKSGPKLTQHTLHYVMEKTGYDALNCPEMQRVADAIRRRTYTRFYKKQRGQKTEPPDFELLTQLRSAALNDRSLINMLSGFVGRHNLQNAWRASYGQDAESANLVYEDLQVISHLIETYGAEFVANTLLAQAMSKRPKEDEDRTSEANAPTEQPATS